jgi:hypothetical protein
MPLSLRRPTRKVNGPDSPLRSASTPTLLSRLRSSTFSRSKVSLLSSQAYDSVRSRTPPTLSPSLPDPPTTHSVVKDRVDAGRRGRYLMTVEQRECLAGAEVLRIFDPVTGMEGESGGARSSKLSPRAISLGWRALTERKRYFFPRDDTRVRIRHFLREP